MQTECGYGLRRAQIIMSGATVSPYLDGVLASTVFDIDATIAASYPGSGVTWAKLAAPADESAQAAYDFYRGNGSTSTTYPAFNGSAGSSAAYWSFDGNDHFDLNSGVNTPFLRDVHKTTGGSDFWIAMAFRPVDNGATTGYFTTMAGTSVPGLRIEQLSNEFTRLLHRAPIARPPANAAARAVQTVPGPSAGSVLAVRRDCRSVARYRDWVNRRT